MRIVLCILTLAFSFLSAAAQDLIRGRVVSGETGKPVAGASIFISNTSKGTVTDDKGDFVLYNIPVGRYVLVISYIGFQTDLETIDSRYPRKDFAITLRVKTTELGEVTVRAFDADGYKKWGELFRENFIGTSDFARKCKILNPEVIKIHFAKKSRVLSAYSDGAILISNPALGYDVQVTLESFRLEFVSGGISFSFFPLFKEMVGTPRQQKRWADNRVQAYYGSPLHFFRSLYRDSVEEQGFFVTMLSQTDSLMIHRVKSQLRYALSVARDSAGPAGNRMSPEALLTPEVLQQYDNILDSRRSTSKLEYPGMVPTADIIVARDSNVAVMDYDLVLKVKYLRKRVEDRYLNDVIIDPNQPEKGHKINVTRPSGEGMTTELELLRGFPVEVFANGSNLNSDLMYQGYWTWSQKMGNLLPYDYVPPPATTPPGPPYN